jgi:hypothetical protein
MTTTAAAASLFTKLTPQNRETMLNCALTARRAEACARNRALGLCHAASVDECKRVKCDAVFGKSD